MNHIKGSEKGVLLQQNIYMEENNQNNREVTIITPILPFQNEDITQKSISQNQQQTVTVQLVITAQNQAAKQGTSMNEKIRPLGKNLLTLQKKYRQLVNINPNSNETSNREDTDATPAEKLHKNQQDLGTILPVKQFHRTELRNYPKSLHVIMRQNDENTIDTVFPRKGQKIISQQYSQRRYPEQGVNDSQRGQKQTIRKSLLGTINNTTNANSQFIKTNSSHKRYQWQSLAKLDEQIYNHPEKNFKRVVVFIKTYIISQFQSVSIQVSLLKGSLIIVGNLFGEQNQTIRMVVNQEKTEKLFNQSSRDWEVLGRRVGVQMGSGGGRIKIGAVRQRGENNNNTTQSSSHQHQRQRSYMKRRFEMRKKQTLFRQRQFIRRNYYSIITKSSNPHETISSTVQHEPSSINYPSRKYSTIQHRKILTPYFINCKQIDYLSPQIKQQIKQIQKDKFVVDRDKIIQDQKLKKETFLKRQKLFTQRISQSKQKNHRLQRYSNSELIKENTKSKGRHFTGLKVGSLNSIGQKAIQNCHQIKIQFNSLVEKVGNEQNCKVQESDNLICIHQQQNNIINEKQQSQQGDHTQRELEMKRIQSSFEQKHKSQQSRGHQSSQDQVNQFQEFNPNQQPISQPSQEKTIQQPQQQSLKVHNSQYSALIREIEDEDQYEIVYQSHMDEGKQHSHAGQQHIKEREDRVQSDYEQSFERDDQIGESNMLQEQVVGYCDQAVQQEEDYLQEEFMDEFR